MTTDLNQLPAHVRQAMQRVANIAGTSIEFVDPAPFVDLPEPEDNSSLGRMARQAAAYREAVAAKRAEAEIAELREVAAADLPSKEELAEMARRYGVSAESLLAQYVEKKTAAQEALHARKSTIEATRRAAEQQAAEARLNEAIATRNFSTMIDFGKDKSNPTLQAVARAAMATTWPGWKWD